MLVNNYVHCIAAFINTVYSVRECLMWESDAYCETTDNTQLHRTLAAWQTVDDRATADID